ncbi:hypothetical protein BIW11_05234 [Tropilaelaps mercedesae]|uniref:Uncharacterized protein n=1 Tax=Tropilaelaps mercedesae TaxID=418985 RepID=A0A1V9Y353_9ACAR|nr:hypothetical protein BIW11_05234 [Tropilaelaps mercedesae]
MAVALRQVIICTIGVCMMLATATQAQRNRISVFGYPGDNFVDHECAPVGRCPRPCRLGKETTGCALCVCPPACRPCYSECYYPSRPDECPHCAPELYCELGSDPLYPGFGIGPGLGLGR